MYGDILITKDTFCRGLKFRVWGNGMNRNRALKGILTLNYFGM